MPWPVHRRQLRRYDGELAAILARSALARVVHAVVGGHTLQVHGHAAALAGQLYAIQCGPVDVLRVLAQTRENVLCNADIRRLADGLTDVDDHAIETGQCPCCAARCRR